jgi:hypothetical protein
MKRAMKKKGRGMKMERMTIAAIILVAFLGTVKNRYGFILRNMGDKK